MIDKSKKTATTAAASASVALSIANSDTHSCSYSKSRKDALLRIASKKKQMQNIATVRAEEELKLLTLHRLNWRSGLKGKRMKHLEDRVDEYILRGQLNSRDKNNINNNTSKQSAVVASQLRKSIEYSQYTDTKAFQEKFCCYAGSDTLFNTNSSLSRLCCNDSTSSSASKVKLVRNDSITISSSGINITPSQSSCDENVAGIDDGYIGNDIDEFSLIDMLVLIGPSTQDICSKMTPEMLSSSNQVQYVEPRFVYTIGNDNDIIDVMPYFCFPSGIRVLKATDDKHLPHSKPFVFVLTGESTSHFGVCFPIVKTVSVFVNGIDCSVSTEYCVCAVTKFPFIHYILHIIQTSYNLGLLLSEISTPLPTSIIMEQSLPSNASATNNVNDTTRGTSIPSSDISLQLFENMARTLRRVIIQISNGAELPTVHFSLPYHSSTLSSTQSININLTRNIHKLCGIKSIENSITVDDHACEATHHMLMWALPILLRHFPLNQIVLMLGCILSEMKIVVHCQDLSVVSGVLLALSYLIRPLVWAGPTIVTLPTSLHTFLESPVPIIVGMQSLPQGFISEAGIVIVDPQLKNVTLHPKDTVVSHTLTLPKASSLLVQLQATAKAIVKVSGGRTNSVVLTPDSNYLPMEIDTDSSVGMELQHSIYTFCQAMEVHMQSIATAAVNRSWIHKQNETKVTMSSEPNDDLPPMESMEKQSSSTAISQDGNVIFLSRFLTTQMFSEYCRKSSIEHKRRLVKFNNESVPIETSTDSVGSQLVATPAATGTAGVASTVRGSIGDYAATAAADDLSDAVTISKHTPAVGRLRAVSLAPIMCTTDSTVAAAATAVDPLDLLFSVLLTGGKCSSSSGSSRDVAYDELWCNGRCGGASNTHLCTNICLKQWEAKTKADREIELVKKLQAKHAKFCHRPVKHLKETDTQYHKRVGLIVDGNYPDYDIRNPAPEGSVTSGCDDGDVDRHIVRSIARHYAYKRCVAIRYNAMRRINSFIIKYYDRRKFHYITLCTVLLQKIARGYVVRNNIPSLVESLCQRKDRRRHAAYVIASNARKWYKRLDKRSTVIFMTGSNTDSSHSSTASPSSMQSYINAFRSKSSSDIHSNSSSMSVNNSSTSPFTSGGSERDVRGLTRPHKAVIHLGERARNILNRFLYRQQAHYSPSGVTLRGKSTFSSITDNSSPTPPSPTPLRHTYPVDGNDSSSSSSSNIGTTSAVAVANTSVGTASGVGITDGGEVADDTTIRKLSATSSTSIAATEYQILTTLDVGDCQSHSVTTATAAATTTTTASSTNAGSIAGTASGVGATVVGVTADHAIAAAAVSEVDAKLESPFATTIATTTATVGAATVDSTAPNDGMFATSSTAPALVTTGSKQTSFDILIPMTAEVYDDDNCEGNDAMWQSRKVQVLPYPLNSLGAEARDGLTPQQLEMILCMYQLLHKGVMVTKHGTSGKPHTRYLFCNNDMTVLYWRATCTPDNDSGSHTAGDTGSSSSSSSSSSSDNKSREHVHNKRKTLIASITRVNADRELCFSDILDVNEDMSTNVMRRSLAMNQFVGNEDSTGVISIVLKGRSLDFEVDHKHWATLFHAFQVISNYYQIMLPSMRASCRVST